MIVLAKAPVPGRVKTRLQAAFSPQQAADLAACALRDTLTAVATARTGPRVLALDGELDGFAPQLAAAGFTVIAQRPGALGDRLAGAFSDVSGPALLIGMDTPQVAARHLEVDFDGADALLGLAVDGGFWAIGLSEGAANRIDPARVFADVPMSTSRTGAAQLARLVGLGLTVSLLPPMRDVDTPADAEQVAAAYPDLEFSRRYRELTVAWPQGSAERFFDSAYDGEAVSVGPADQIVLARCEPPVLVVGCGPGRMVQALQESGQPALGIDISAVAVEASRTRGGMVLRARVEDPLPAEGRWGTVLLVDGNVGFGGDVPALLSRCRELVTPGGLILCEVDPTPTRHDNDEVMLQGGTGSLAPLPWSRVGSLALGMVAAQLDLLVAEEWSVAGRVFVALRRTL